MPYVNESLPFGFGYDRALLMDVAVGVEMILPILNTLILHPTVLYLVWKGASMSVDIRLGYLSTVLGLIFSDCCTFLLRPYMLAPYSAIHFDGPLARAGRIELITIRALFALTAALCFPCFVFLTVRMHRMLLRGSGSQRYQCALFLLLFSIVQLNVFAFAWFAVNSEKSNEIAKRPELSWINDRGGTLLIFGDFGQPEKLTYGLAVLAVAMVTHAPVVIGFSMHSIRRLKTCRECVISNRTLQMTNQMVEVLDRQLKGAILHIWMPLLVFLIVSLVDTACLFPDCLHAALRFIASMLFVTNPFQFTLIFILKTRGHAKLLSSLRSVQSLQYQNILKDSPVANETEMSLMQLGKT